MSAIPLRSRQRLHDANIARIAASMVQPVKHEPKLWGIFEYRSKRELLWIKACLCALPVLFLVCQIVWSVT